MALTVEGRLAEAARSADSVLLEGLHAIKHAIRFGAEIDLIASRDPARALELAASLCPDVIEIMRPLLQAVRSREELEIGGRPIATDLCGAATKPDFDVTALQQPTGGPIILLDHPRSLANVGAAIRIAAATAAAGVLTTGDQDPWHPVALRGSAGLHFAQPVGRVEIDDLTAERPIIGFDAGGQHFNPSELPPTAVLAFGSERHGISDALRERCSMIVALPMREGVSSLNLATSVAAVLMSWRVGTGWTGR